MTPEPAPTVPVMQIWGGYPLLSYLRLLARNAFRIDRGYRVVALANAVGCGITSVLAFLHKQRYAARIAATPLTAPPLFVLGHWRSGTTFLHDLLALDPRHIYPNTYECFMPCHFLISEAYIKRRFPMQSQHRSMDEVEWSWDTPQEDEWALALLGQPSPYLTIAFPNLPPACPEYLDLEGLPEQRRTAWKRTLQRFLQALTFKRPGRLVLKSPTHTARIKVLLEAFPDARFVHIVRNPYHVIPSTFKTFNLVYGSMGLQRGPYVRLEDMVYSTYRRMMARLEEGKSLVPPGRFHELKYEDLARDPIGQVQATYAALDLGDFAVMRPHLESYVAKLKNYHTGEHALPEATQRRIGEECREVIERYGYQQPHAGTVESTPGENE